MQNTIRFAIIGDCHSSYSNIFPQRDCLAANNRLSDIINILNSKQLDFVFSMGDLGDGLSEDEVSTVSKTVNIPLNSPLETVTL